MPVWPKKQKTWAWKRPHGPWGRMVEWGASSGKECITVGQTSFELIANVNFS